VCEVLVPKGTSIIIDIRGVNVDPATFGSDALEWKPERWHKPILDSVSDARIPGVYSNMCVLFVVASCTMVTAKPYTGLRSSAVIARACTSP
jgi:cytochrome P450